MAISVDISDDRSTMIVSLQGSLGYSDWPEFQSKCLHASYPSRLLVDFRNLEEINVAGFSMLLLLHRRLPASSGKSTLLVCDQRIKQFLDYLGYEEWFSIPEGCSYQLAGRDCGQICQQIISSFRSGSEDQQWQPIANSTDPSY